MRGILMGLAAMVALAGCGGAPASVKALARPAEGPRAASAETTAPGSRGPVLLVHGHHGSAANFAAMVPRLKAEGWDPTALDFVTNDWKDWTLDDLATQVGLHVMAIKNRTKQEKIDLVAHSLGGIVVRQYLKFHGGDQHVRRVICLGAPHHGVGFAALGPWIDIAKLFAPHGAALNKLNRPDETPGDVQYTNLWSPSDWAEWLPYASGRLVGAFNYRVVKTPHADYPTDPRVFEVVKESLLRPLDRVPGAEVDIAL
jgi:triacylglycerol esterase/lipase EstA (alpha/beta hydrolase family)